MSAQNIMKKWGITTYILIRTIAKRVDLGKKKDSLMHFDFYRKGDVYKFCPAINSLGP